MKFEIKSKKMCKLWQLILIHQLGFKSFGWNSNKKMCSFPSLPCSQTACLNWFQHCSVLKQVKHFQHVSKLNLGECHLSASSSTDFKLIASVNLTTSIYIISSFTLNRLIKSRAGIEDRHSRCYIPSITRLLFCLFYSRPKLEDKW